MRPVAFSLDELARLVSLVGSDDFASAVNGNNPQAKALIAKCRAVLLASRAGQEAQVTWAPLSGKHPW